MRLLVFLPVFLANCVQTPKPEELSAKEHFEKALENKKNKNYAKSIENLTDLRRFFFYSPYNQKALLLTADVYFLDRQYEQAIESYKKHLNLYPNKDKDYVLYKIGLSYRNQMPRLSSYDLSQSQPALEALNHLLSMEESQYKEKAVLIREEILNKQAEKQLNIALFYKKLRWNQTAFHRLNYVISNYPNSLIMPKAYLAAFQLAEVLNKNPEKFKEKLLKKYPDSEEAKSVLERKPPSLFSKWGKKIWNILFF